MLQNDCLSNVHQLAYNEQKGLGIQIVDELTNTGYTDTAQPMMLEGHKSLGNGKYKCWGKRLNGDWGIWYYDSGTDTFSAMPVSSTLAWLDWICNGSPTNGSPE